MNQLNVLNMQPKPNESKTFSCFIYNAFKGDYFMKDSEYAAGVKIPKVKSLNVALYKIQKAGVVK